MVSEVEKIEAYKTYEGQVFELRHEAIAAQAKEDFLSVENNLWFDIFKEGASSDDIFKWLYDHSEHLGNILDDIETSKMLKKVYEERQQSKECAKDKQ